MQVPPVIVSTTTTTTTTTMKKSKPFWNQVYQYSEFHPSDCSVQKALKRQCLQAHKNIKRGDLIFCEVPLIMIPGSRVLEDNINNTIADNITESGGFYSSLELILYEMLLNDANNTSIHQPKEWLNLLTNHYGLRKTAVLSAEENSKIQKFYEKHGRSANWSKNTFDQLVHIVKYYLFKLRGPIWNMPIGAAIYNYASFLKHNYITPNCSYFFDRNGSIYVYAEQDLFVGDIVEISYYGTSTANCPEFRIVSACMDLYAAFGSRYVSPERVAEESFQSNQLILKLNQKEDKKYRKSLTPKILHDAICEKKKKVLSLSLITSILKSTYQLIRDIGIMKIKNASDPCFESSQNNLAALLEQIQLMFQTRDESSSTLCQLHPEYYEPFMDCLCKYLWILPMELLKMDQLNQLISFFDANASSFKKVNIIEDSMTSKILTVVIYETCFLLKHYNSIHYTTSSPPPQANYSLSHYRDAGILFCLVNRINYDFIYTKIRNGNHELKKL